MSDWDKLISDVNRAHRDANMQAMRSTGRAKRIYLTLARLLDWAGDLGREAQREEQRGKDDTYHGEY